MLNIVISDHGNSSNDDKSSEVSDSECDDASSTSFLSSISNGDDDNIEDSELQDTMRMDHLIQFDQKQSLAQYQQNQQKSILRSQDFPMSNSDLNAVRQGEIKVSTSNATKGIRFNESDQLINVIEPNQLEGDGNTADPSFNLT